MTENEAIEALKNNYPKMCKMVNGRYQGGFDNTESDFGQALTMAISVLKEIQQYRKIGTVEECREAVEKQKPKKPKELDTEYEYFICGNCGGAIACTDDFKSHKYCLNCGQAINWEESE